MKNELTPPELICAECDGELEIEPDWMDDHVPVCNNTECALYGQPQLPLDDDERSLGPKQSHR